jgi:putative ABC transport system permease protein
MGVIRYKIWSDLWENKGRTLQVVLIIAMGAAAIGMIITTRNLLIPGMEEIWRSASPAMITLWADPQVDDDTIAALKGIEGVEDAEGFASTSIEWRLNPADQWSAGSLVARDDYKDQRYTTVNLLSGEWPKEKAFDIGQGTDTTYGIKEGGEIHIRVNDREYVVRITGTIYDPVIQPPSFGGPAQFYATRDRFGDLTGNRDFNRIMAGAPKYDELKVTDIANKIQRKLEKQDVDSGGASPPDGRRVVDPNKHFFQDAMDGIFLVLGIMSIVALILGLFLVYNTINAIVSQQVNQIGIMKAIGAKMSHILWVYLLNVFAYGVLALLIAIPLGLGGGWLLNLFLMDSFNADPGPFTISWLAVEAQVAIALLAPLLASLIPIFVGARITVREAISTYGLNVKAGLLERVLGKMERVSRTILLTISNTFRNKRRVILTQISLVLSGLIFMMILGVWDSTAYTFGDLIFSILRFDVSLAFEDPERIHRVEELTLTHPDVEAVEMWGLDSGTIRLADQPESDDDESVLLFGVPLPTTLYGPQMRAGRWLEPGSTQAIVLNEKLAEDAGVGIGDWVTIDHGVKGESTWQVVGLLFDPVISESAHVSRQTMLQELNSVGKASTIWIQTVRSDPDGQVAAAQNLREYYEHLQLDLRPRSPFGQDTASEITSNILGQFGVIITLLAVVAVIIGLVGAIALSGALSLNVLERRREIGVMRAIGASSGTIARLFIGEGLILGWLSWLIALPLSIPAARLMTQTLGQALQSNLVYKYTPTGAIYWLTIITVLSILASLLPARGAMRVSVRESLAYQ